VGNTPLVRSRAIGPAVGLEQLYFKLESCNPTGSYKDRFATVAISQMLAAGKKRCLATSSGNAGAALAAHCAAAGLECEIAVIVTAPLAKLNQMRVYGADIQRIAGFGLDDKNTRESFAYLQQLGQEPDASLQITAYCFSPEGMEGVKTISYELAEQLPSLGQQPAHVFIPAGGCGLALAVARGFEDLRGAGQLQAPVRVQVVQPSGNDTMATALRTHAAQGNAVTCTSQISGLQVPSVLDGNALIVAARQSGGNGYVVDDPTVWQIQRRLALEEGILCEPAGAVALAGALQAAAAGEIASHEPVICLVTGAGYKDEASLARMRPAEPCETITLEEYRQRHA
jgi:threonine synthase